MRQRRRTLPTRLSFLLVVTILVENCQASFVAVDLQDGSLDVTLQLAAQACIGLFNSRQGGSAYSIFTENDKEWIQLLAGVPSPSATLNATSFLHTCHQQFPRCVTYDLESQQKLLPNILTIAAVQEAIPVDPSRMPLRCDGTVVVDATKEFRHKETPYLATKHTYENYVQDTTGLAMLTPGYQHNGKQCWNPPLNQRPEISLVDFVFSQKLFAIFLVNGCIPLTQEHRLMERITHENPWQQSPIPVYGYARYWKVFGGDLFEAHTRCTSSRNMGAIPTEVNNLSFFSSQRKADTTPQQQNPLESIPYNPQKTYVAFVVGDGDNVNYILNARREWMLQRQHFCRLQPTTCLPLSWTLSPHLPRLAPDVLEWYYQVANTTGQDYFLLPPSGHLYSYPSSFEKQPGKDFIQATEADAQRLGTHSVVTWDWFTTWHAAIHKVLPRYAVKGQIQGLFPLNVPYIFPILTRWRGRRFQILKAPKGNNNADNTSGKVVLFRPRSWRGVEGTGGKEFVTPQQMAHELASFPKGTVTFVYMTSDGGLTLENSFLELAHLLSDHVQLVSTDTAARLALEADRLRPVNDSWWASLWDVITALFDWFTHLLGSLRWKRHQGILRKRILRIKTKHIK